MSTRPIGLGALKKYVSIQKIDPDPTWEPGFNVFDKWEFIEESLSP